MDKAARDRLGVESPLPEQRQFVKTKSMPMSPLIHSNKSGEVEESHDANAEMQNDTLFKEATGMPHHMDFASTRLGSAFWTAREHLVVKNRQGSVLTRGLIVKTDHFAGVRKPNLGVHLQGAPNFRQADISALQVYGVAQPTITGLKTILSVLQCAPIPDRDVKNLQIRRGRTSSPRTAEPTERSSSANPRLDDTRRASKIDVLDLPKGIESALSHRHASYSGILPGLDSVTEKRCVWACTRNEPVIYVGSRPFVLREVDQPFENFQLSERADNLESIEQRLKIDILRESARYGGLLMVHEEDENGSLKPAWVAVGPKEVKTVRETWELIRSEGWRCDYHRIPIAEDQPMENNYLDAYTQIIKNIDPRKTAFVANCGMGVRRTSFAMVAAVLVRRRQMMLLGLSDPFKLEPDAYKMTPKQLNKIGQVPASRVVKSLKVANEKQTDAHSTLQVVQVLNESLSEVGTKQTAVEILLNQPLLLDALRSAKEGNYGIIRQLVGLLDEGETSKIAVDMAIDACSHVIHLRHSILEARVKYALSATDLQQVNDGTNRSRTANTSLSKAVTSLEQYHLLVTFGSYVGGSETAVFKHRFATWLRNRAEITNQITRIRSKGSQLYFFDPIADLSTLSKEGAKSNARALVQRRNHDPNLVPGDEFADHIVRNRAGLVLRPFTLLKEDIWRGIERLGKLRSSSVRGAVNFRRIPGSNVFATGQPTVAGIRNILKSIADQLNYHDANAEPLEVTFINLREEPLCHVNGKPYCLRQKGMSLRNIKSYSGISWSRLTLLEDRLKNDLLKELNDGDGRLLLHSETEEGDIVPLWEAASPNDVETLQDVMTKISGELEMTQKSSQDESISRMPNVQLVYRRVPITAEKPPDHSEIAAIMRTILRSKMRSNHCIVLNCQLGRGRSTMMSIIVLLLTRWLRGTQRSKEGVKTLIDDSIKHKALSYHIINSLLRVIPQGLAVKKIVDEEIDRSASVINLRDVIEEARLAAEDTEDESVKRIKITNGVNNLRRYFELIVFQSYLEATPVHLVEKCPTFETYVEDQPVFHTLSQELSKIDLSTITPLQKVDKSDGMALNEEVQEVVSNRVGNVLSAYTMLKSDMFPGLAAQALSQIEGIPNMRGVSAVLGHPHAFSSNLSTGSVPTTPLGEPSNGSIETWGHGMPSIDGLRRGLERMGAGPKGNLEVVATSLREEAVCVVNGRPHVLRLADQPFTNVEATGITTEAVERMEEALKQDIIAEIAKYDGRILLHDEKINEQNGKFEIIPVWETVRKEDVLTPSEMYQIIQRENYRVQYARVAVTDEQAPIPAVFHEMEERVLQALRTGAACVWNCQMGRGRTTTGMVIAALVSTVAHYGGELFESDLSASIVSWSGFVNGNENGNDQNQADEMEDLTMSRDAIDNREDELWLQGEYRSVLQLVAILRHGKLAKRLTDAAIDRVDAVQNLRKAIYDSKVRAENADKGTSKYKHLQRVYINYLQRYSYLIVFGNYLLEKSQTLLERGHTKRSASSIRSYSHGRKVIGMEDNRSDKEEEEEDDDNDNHSVISTATMSTSRVSMYASQFAMEESRLKFPTFVNWLQPRREIAKIVALEDR